MALIKDGYWQDTYWTSRYWQEDYWPEYSAAVTPSIEGGRWIGKAVLRKKPRLALSLAIKQFFEAELNG